MNAFNDDDDDDDDGMFNTYGVNIQNGKKTYCCGSQVTSERK